jgi:hypothetical protein
MHHWEKTSSSACEFAKVTTAGNRKKYFEIISVQKNAK